MKINSLLGIFYFLLIAANYALKNFRQYFTTLSSKISKFPVGYPFFRGPRKTKVLWGEEKPSDGQGLGCNIQASQKLSLSFNENSLLGIFYFLLIAANYALKNFRQYFTTLSSKISKFPVGHL